MHFTADTFRLQTDRPQNMQQLKALKQAADLIGFDLGYN